MEPNMINISIIAKIMEWLDAVDPEVTVDIVAVTEQSCPLRMWSCANSTAA